jgi:hypothetical protein
MNVIIFTRIKSVNSKNITFLCYRYYYFYNNFLVHTWRLSSCLNARHSLCIHGAWATASVLSKAYAQVALRLLLVGWALPDTHVALELHWVVQFGLRTWAAPPQAGSTPPPGAWSTSSWVHPKRHVVHGLPILLV